MTERLYIIGNGFDIHHQLPTRYSNFGEYLAEKNMELYDLLNEVIGYPDGDDDLWYNFEANLANLDVEDILSRGTDSLPNYGSDDFRERDRYDFEHNMRTYLEKLTTELLQEFRDFIESVVIDNKAFAERIRLDNTAKFFNFNYTPSLQVLYNVREDQIKYIHNAAHDQTSQIVLGHGIEPDQLKKKDPVPPADLSDEDMQRWMDEQSDNYDHSYNLGEQMIRGYFDRSFKPTKEIIERNNDYFQDLSAIKEVVIFGHSISDVDMNYFRKIAASVNTTSTWSISYFSNNDKTRIAAAMQKLNINEDRYNLFKISDLKLNNSQGNLSV